LYPYSTNRITKQQSCAHFQKKEKNRRRRRPQTPQNGFRINTNTLRLKNLAKIKTPRCSGGDMAEREEGEA
jgi:hypothetical protein